MKYKFDNIPDCTISHGYTTVQIIGGQAEIDDKNPIALEIVLSKGGVVVKPERAKAKEPVKKEGK